MRFFQKNNFIVNIILYNNFYFAKKIYIFAKVMRILQNIKRFMSVRVLVWHYDDEDDNTKNAIYE